MFPRFDWRLPAVAGALLASACAHVPRDAGRAEVDALLDARLGSTATASIDTAWRDGALAATLSRDDAVRIALTDSPRVQAAYARLGFSRAEVMEAGRLANPRLSFAFLHGGNVTEITRGIVVPFTDLLMLPARRRLAALEFESSTLEVSALLLDLARDTEAAWYRAVAARQHAAMRDAIAEAADVSAALAQRYADAGNLPPVELGREIAQASEARIDAVRARRDAERARIELLVLMGVERRDVALPDRLPPPLPADEDEATLVVLMTRQRVDLAASRKHIDALTQALATVRRWRLLGDVDIGYERTREADGERLRGPTLELAIPLFQQGQPAVARAEARLAEAIARQSQDEHAATASLHNALADAAAARDIASEYQQRLVPQREAIVARTQEQVNYMLVGTFELLAAKRDEYAAYAGLLDAVRDYWIARADLRRAVGGALPLDGTEPPSDLAPRVPSTGDDAMPAHHQHHAPASRTTEPLPAREQTQKTPAESSHEHHHTPTPPPHDTSHEHHHSPSPESPR